MVVLTLQAIVSCITVAVVKCVLSGEARDVRGEVKVIQNTSLDTDHYVFADIN